MPQDISLNLDYNPVTFLRCHSKTDKDTADVRTQIWQVDFNPNSNLDSVATCGGNKVCVINLGTSPKVEQRYSALDTDNLFALTWSHVLIDKRESSILIVGGDHGVLYFISPEEMCQVAHFSVPKQQKRSKIYSLTFHPEKKNSFFCAMSTGDINFLQADLSFKSRSKINLITTFSCSSEIVRTAMCDYSSTLFAATSSGLYGWSINIEDFTEWKNKKITFNLQMSSNNMKPKEEMVDSVEILDDGFVATKYGSHAFIYIWHVKHSIVNSDPESRVIDIVPFYKLVWCLTDNFYMEISANCEIGLLTCGDDKGSIWFYDIRCLKTYDGPPSETKVIEKIQRISWPKVNDEYHVKSKKLSLETDDIVIGKAVLSCSGHNLVAITNRNTVCLWSKSS